MASIRYGINTNILIAKHSMYDVTATRGEVYMIICYAENTVL